ncbi:hypothetical protein BGZ76_006442 [Entomortierella beljakovae]|nr:hypothetical protein BGZ76_006442 [Entomortierella beljakovae]
MNTSSTAAKPKPSTTAKATPTATKSTAPTKATTSVNNSSKRPTSTASSTTGTISPSPSSTDSTSSSGLSTPAIAGIGAAGGLIVLFLLAILVCKKRRAHQYSKRNYGYDPSRDPIDPNVMYPVDNKSKNPLTANQQDDPEFTSYPMSTRNNAEQDSKPQNREPIPQDSRANLNNNVGGYPQYEGHIQSHFSPDSPQVANRGLAITTGPLTSQPLNQTQSSNSPMSPPLMSPSQRAQMSNQRNNSSKNIDMISGSPRSNTQPQMGNQSGPNTMNDMGSQFVLQPSQGSGGNNNRQFNDQGRDSIDQEGSIVQSELSYRRTQGKGQEMNNAGGYPSQPSPNSNSGYPSPQKYNGQPGPNNNGGSPYTSPRHGPSSPSPRSPPMQYQPPSNSQQPYQQQYQQQYQQPYQQQQPPYQQPSPQHGPGYGSNQRPYPGGNTGRSPPLDPRGPGYSNSQNQRPRQNNY